MYYVGKQFNIISKKHGDSMVEVVEVEVEVEGGGGCGGGGGGGGCAGPPVPVQWWWRVRGNQARRCLGSICTGQSVSQSVRNQL